MALAIDSVAPPQGRAGDVVLVEGSGFGDDASLLQVVFGAFPATVLSISPRVLELLVPAGIPTDRQVILAITDQADANNKDSIAWMSRAPRATLLAARLAGQEPNVLEDILREVSSRPEAKDFERLAAREESLVRELLPGAAGAGRVGVDRDALGVIGTPNTLALALQRASRAVLDRERLVGRRRGYFATQADGGGFPRAEQDLAQVLVPGGSLARPGDSLLVHVAGEIGEEPVPERELAMRLYFGGTVVADLVATPVGRLGAELRAVVTRIGPNSQSAGGIGLAGGRLLGGYLQGEPGDATEASPAEDLSGDVVVKVTGQEVSGTGGAEAALVAVKALRVELVRRSEVALGRAAADAVSVSEALSVVIRTFRRSLADAISAADAVARIIPERSVADAVVATDAIDVASAEFSFVGPADYAPTTDAVEAELAIEAAPADAVGTSDSVLAETEVAGAASDAASVTDAASPSVEAGRVLLDLATLAVVTSEATTLGGEASDSASVADGLALGGDASLALDPDAVAAGDEMELGGDVALAIGDDVAAVSDGATRELTS